MAARKQNAALSPVLPPQQLPPYAVETWSVDRLKPYERNARKHPAEQIEQLRGSVRKFGQVWPILVRPDGTVIAGHGRFEALKVEGFTELKVIVAAGWSEEQCRAFGLLDNKVALNSEWDEDALGLELADLSTLGVGLGDLGFGEDELSELLAGNGQAVETPAERAERSGLGKAVIQFNIVFDDEGQQEQWFAFVRQLKTKFADEETLGARLSKFLTEQARAPG